MSTFKPSGYFLREVPATFRHGFLQGGETGWQPRGIRSAATVGMPGISSVASLGMSGVSSSAVLGAPVASSNARPDNLSSSPTVGAPGISSVGNVGLTGVSASPAVGAPGAALQGSAVPTGISSSPAVGGPGIAAVDGVAPSGLTISSTVGTPTIDSAAGVGPSGVSSSPVVGAPAILLVTGVLPSGLMASAVVGAPGASSPGSTESIWDHGSYTPPNLETGDATVYTMGNVIRFSAAGTVSSIWWYRVASDPATTYTARFFNADTGAELETGQITGQTGSGWKEIPLDAPVSVVTTTWYLCAVDKLSGGYYGTITGMGSTGITSGNIIVPTAAATVTRTGGAGNGRYFTTGGGFGFPDLHYNNEGYAADVSFTAD